MPSSGSCSRCARPLALESEDGLCATCRSETDTSRAAPMSAGADVTRTHQPSRDADATKTHSPRPGPTPRPAPPPADVTPDDRAGWRPAPLGYELIRKFPGGGMGAVYLAREHATERSVAMKFVGDAANSSAVERFLVELKALAALDHPNIVRVLSHDFYRADPYFTMEYESGGTLKELVEREGPLPPPRAVTLIRQVAAAVKAAHAKGIIHRDLKPSNVLLGADGVPKVSDFGLAKRTDRDDGITAGSGGLGTPGYMPPEQVSKKWGRVGVASDVYGLGATLYHLLTDQPPFQGDDNNDTMNRVVRDPLTLPRALRPEIPLAVEAVVVKCLEKNPADRYPTADALIADLDGCLADEPRVAAPIQTRRLRLRRWAWRRRRAVAAVALGLIVSLAVAVIVADPTDPRDEIRRELARGRKVTLIGESGGPRWHEWQLAPGKFEALQDGDTVCSFLSRDVSLLVLLDDPGIDRYVVRAEVRQNLKAGEQDPRANKSTDSVGLAIGHTTLRAGGFRIDSLMLLGFSDHDRPGPPEADKRLTLRHVALAGQPLAPKGVFQERGPNTPLSPPYDAVRPWRPIGFEVTPDGVAPLAGTAFASHPRATIERRMADLGTQLRTSPARFAGTLPVWSPRSPVGIWCNGSWVSVRNVTIEPLPIPR